AKTDIGATLRALLAHPIIASKESVVRQYDHEVQGGSVVKPFMGPDKDGPTDACVFRPKLDVWRGVAVTNGLCPEMGKWDPYLMAKFAVDEAYRNLIAVAGGLKEAAILDNFCWGDNKNAQDLAGLVRASEGAKEAALAYGLPFISGKDSFHNTWRAADGTLHSIPPTLLISAIGVLEDVRTCVTSGLKGADSLLYLVGETRPELRGSLAAAFWGDDSGKLPFLRLTEARGLYRKLQTAMKHRTVSACHDLSEGGLAVAAAEMAFGSAYGVELELQQKPFDFATQLFSETPSRFLVEVPAVHREAFEQTMGLLLVERVGRTIKKPDFVVKSEGVEAVNVPISALKDLWKNGVKGL
ncbi:MAG: phosphoribosylformylglycinamidine synthase subunit PurL, partial [Elusimicrobia bacterium]|nr:phosphoribosylformylglycinamidine synthase subunit PurL [Elusimicrobiota bacterium]